MTKHTLTISLIVNKFFSLIFLLSNFIGNNNLESWIEKNNYTATSSDVLSIEFNMVRYNKINPFKKIKDRKPYLFIIDRSSRFYLQTNDIVSIFNGDSFVSYNKKTNQSFILNHDDKVTNSIMNVIFFFDIQDYEYTKINNIEYDFSFDNNVKSKVLFNESSNLEKITGT